MSGSQTSPGRTTSGSATQADRRRARTWFLLAGVAAGLYVVSLVDPFDYVWLDRTIGLPYAAPLAALVFLCAGLHARTGNPFLVTPVLVVGLVALAGVAVIGGGAPWPWSPTQGWLPASTGRYAVVVEPRRDLLDPQWNLSLETGSGLATRRIKVGCVNGDEFGEPVVAWSDDHTLRVEVEGSRGAPLISTITVDPASGRPTSIPAAGELHSC